MAAVNDSFFFGKERSCRHKFSRGLTSQQSSIRLLNTVCVLVTRLIVVCLVCFSPAEICNGKGGC